MSAVRSHATRQDEDEEEEGGGKGGRRGKAGRTYSDELVARGRARAWDVDVVDALAVACSIRRRARDNTKVGHKRSVHSAAHGGCGRSWSSRRSRGGGRGGGVSARLDGGLLCAERRRGLGAADAGAMEVLEGDGHGEEAHELGGFGVVGGEGD